MTAQGCSRPLCANAGAAAPWRRTARALSVGAAALAGLLSGGASWGADLRLPEGPGANVVYSKCQTCHDLQYVVDAKGLLPAQWNAVLASMRDYGLQIDDAQAKQVLQYLTTYLGPHPPPAASASAAASTGASAASARAVDGSKVYAENCATCHGAAGLGQPGYYPPLAGNPDLARDALPIVVVLNGLSGPIEVGGRAFDNSMPPLDYLSNAEIAAVVDFVRGWGSAKLEPVTPEAVAEQRQRRMSPTEVHDYRAKLK